MKSFELKFSGNENENAEHFLKELLECIKNSKIDKKVAFKAAHDFYMAMPPIGMMAKEHTSGHGKTLKKSSNVN